MSAAMNKLEAYKKGEVYMNKYRVIAKHDLAAEPHTWEKGLDYEVVEKGDRFTLASNEGQCNFYAKDKDKIMHNLGFLNK